MRDNKVHQQSGSVLPSPAGKGAVARNTLEPEQRAEVRGPGKLGVGSWEAPQAWLGPAAELPNCRTAATEAGPDFPDCSSMPPHQPLSEPQRASAGSSGGVYMSLSSIKSGSVSD